MVGVKDGFHICKDLLRQGQHLRLNDSLWRLKKKGELNYAEACSNESYWSNDLEEERTPTTEHDCTALHAQCEDMQAACEQSQLVCNRVLIKHFFPSPLLDFLWRQLLSIQQTLTILRDTCF